MSTAATRCISGSTNEPAGRKGGMRLFSNKWLIRAHDERAERELVASLGLRPLTARLLTARGLTEPAAVSSFIKKTDLRFYDPFLLTDMDKAVSRIEQAIRTGERICIYGDYDVDGVTSTTVLYTYLTSRGARCTYFIPDRLSEGYGLSRAAIERLAPDVDLIITVDTGITAAEETAFAASLGDVKQIIHTSGVSPSDTATENIIKINAVGTVNMVEAFYPVLAEGGVMINFSSVAAYAMSKKFVIYFTQKNVVRFAEKHCRILSISPGCYLTPMHQKLIDNQPETAENQLELIPAGRWGYPYDTKT